MEQYIYIIAYHGAHGIENPIVVTMDRNKLPVLLIENFPNLGKEPLFKLAEILQQPDEVLCRQGEGHQLINGPQLYVFHLE